MAKWWSGEELRTRNAWAAVEQSIREDEQKRLTGEFNRRLTDRSYIINALVQMLGPKALEVWNGWCKRGVTRVHHDWTEKAMTEMTGEERAAYLLEVEAAPKTRISLDDIDNPPVSGREPGPLDAAIRQTGKEQ